MADLQKAQIERMQKQFDRAAIAPIHLSLTWSDRAFCIGLTVGTVAGFIAGIALMAFLIQPSL